MYLLNRSKSQISGHRISGHRLISVSLCLVSLVLTSGASAALARGESAWQKSLEAAKLDLNRKELAPAEASFRKAMVEVDKCRTSTENQVKCLNGLASVLKLENKTEESESLYARSLRLLESSYGKTSPKLVHTLMALGSIYESAGDHDLAMNYYSRAININEQCYGPCSPQFASNLSIAELHNKLSSHFARQTDPRSLSEAPGLEASKTLVKNQKNFNGNYVKIEKVDSGRDLLSEFHNELDRIKTDDEIASGKFPLPTGDLKPESAKRSGKI